MLPCLRALAVLCPVAAALVSAAVTSAADKFQVHHFDRLQLTDVYYSEGANFGDIDGDGTMDVVYGPYWFRGPDFKDKRELYPAKAQPREAYSDNFFSWIYDFDGDGRKDVFTVGFPGTPAYVYQNPGPQGLDQPWPKHEVFDWVSNESPHFTQIVGDERPELVCTRDGYFGYATIDPAQPLGTWKFHAISERIATDRFGHGLGVGDVNGDGRLDVIMKDGWFEQPESLEATPQWKLNSYEFAGPGGAEMYAYDVDGDGDNDVITSLHAHAFGLAWYEQLRDGDAITFRQHLIMGDQPSQNTYGVVFSELHSVNLADIDGDGLKDIVTGKTYWSHHTQAPQWDAGAVVYWFKLARTEKGVDWIPYQADGESGIGRQVVVGDINADNLPDIVVGGMKGCHVLIHRQETVDETAFNAAQPTPPRAMASGLSPEEAAARMTLPEGFQVNLFAGEPDVHQPVAMAIDPRGRLWVAEAYTYPIRAEEGKGIDTIVILEDTNGDGRADSRKVFAENLNLVSGMEVGFGGVWVGAAPYLLFIPDQNGDDQPDGPPEVVLDGFGYEDTHETLNTFNWGPDGWLYGCHGVFTHSLVGPPGTAKEDRVPMNAGVWRFHPTKRRFEVFAWGTSNPWGVDFNDHGQAFATACVIPHLFHVIQGGRFERQAGNHFDKYVFEDITTIADHLHYEGNIQDHAWWGHEPELPIGTSNAGGGHAHCGAMIYLGDNWPDQYRDQIFMNNIHGNRVNNDVLEHVGSGYVGHHGPDLLLSNDRWYRGINLRYGPDGSVFLIDWYDRNACHRPTPEIWDRSNGRVYRITYGNPPTFRADLAQLSDDELVNLQLHHNDWFVRVSRRLLQERGGNPQVHQRLLEMLHEQQSVPAKLRALWALHVTGGITPEITEQLLSDSDEYLRAWAIQLALEDQAAPAEIVERLVQLAASEPSPVVRLYLASGLQRLPVDQRWEIAKSLIAHGEDSEDHNLPLMDWYAIEPLVAADAERAIGLIRDCKLEKISRFILRRAAASNDALDVVAAYLSEATAAEQQQMILEEMMAAFTGRVNVPMPPAWSKAYEIVVKSDKQEVRELAEQVAVVMGDQRIFPTMRQLLTSADAALEKRQRALEILVRGRDADAAEAFQAALTEPALRSDALKALAAMNDPDTPSVILAIYEGLTPAERGDAVAALVARPTYAMALLDAVQDKRVPRTDIHAYHIRQLLQFDDEQLAARIRDVWGEIRETSGDKREQIAHLKTLLTAEQLKTANAGRGRLLFDTTCASCHTFFGQGGKVGPDITGSNRADLDYILENIVDPSAVLGKDYRMSVITTVDGRVVSGIVQQETDSALTVRTINDTVIVAKDEIDEQQQSDLSLMPEKLLEPFVEGQVRDLIAYLASPVQVSAKGPPAPIDPATGKVPDAMEGESLKVAAKTAGDAGPQDMAPFTKDNWSGKNHLWWTGAQPGATLDLVVPVAADGTYSLEMVMTSARDYGIVQLSWDDEPLIGSLDLFNGPDVITTGVLEFPPRQLTAGNHRLRVEILGANPQAVPAYMFGLDYLRLVPASEEVDGADSVP